MDNIVFYSYKVNRHDHVNNHEIKRFEHSISTLREFNNEIPVYLFCDDLDFIPPHFESEYGVIVRPFERAYNHGMLFFYRWFNLKFLISILESLMMPIFCM